VSQSEKDSVNDPDKDLLGANSPGHNSGYKSILADGDWARESFESWVQAVHEVLRV
jgi:hypothetical protein